MISQSTINQLSNSIVPIGSYALAGAAITSVGFAPGALFGVAKEITHLVLNKMSAMIDLDVEANSAAKVMRFAIEVFAVVGIGVAAFSASGISASVSLTLSVVWLGELVNYLFSLVLDSNPHLAR